MAREVEELWSAADKAARVMDGVQDLHPSEDEIMEAAGMGSLLKLLKRYQELQRQGEGGDQVDVPGPQETGDATDTRMTHRQLVAQGKLEEGQTWVGALDTKRTLDDSHGAIAVVYGEGDELSATPNKSVAVSVEDDGRKVVSARARVSVTLPQLNPPAEVTYSVGANGVIESVAVSPVGGALPELSLEPGAKSYDDKAIEAAGLKNGGVGSKTDTPVAMLQSTLKTIFERGKTRDLMAQRTAAQGAQGRSQEIGLVSALLAPVRRLRARVQRV